jgi:hypothetical protein
MSCGSRFIASRSRPRRPIDTYFCNMCNFYSIKDATPVCAEVRDARNQGATRVSMKHASAIFIPPKQKGPPESRRLAWEDLPCSKVLGSPPTAFACQWVSIPSPRRWRALPSCPTPPAWRPWRSSPNRHRTCQTFAPSGAIRRRGGGEDAHRSPPTAFWRRACR